MNYCCYAGVLTAAAYLSMSHWGTGVPVAGAVFQFESEFRSFFLPAVILLTILLSMAALFRRCRISGDPVGRNKAIYLMVGLGAAAVLNPAIENIPAVAQLPVSYLGALVNAMIAVIVIKEDRLPELGYILRRALSYCLLLVPAVGIYIGALYHAARILPALPINAVLILISILSVLLFLLAYRLKPVFDRAIDRIFHPDFYVRRQALHGFSSKIANTIDLDEVADELLVTLGKSLRLMHAELLLKNESGFITRYTYPQTKTEGREPLVLQSESAVTEWLEGENRPLEITGIRAIPVLKSASEEDKANLSGSGLAILLPVRGRERMAAILGLSNRKNENRLHSADIDLAIAISNQVGIVIENAQLYAHARQRANIDELTCLYNHRHFHERLLEEVTRSSRYGDVFSLLMIDLDHFKSYNDIRGHLHGDSILKKVGEIIRSNIRSIDVAARYGGDEFSVILPKTSIDSALRIADRVCNSMESEFNNEGMSITCSIGVASWPTDGIIKGDLLHAADTALYQAKKLGRNRVFTASKLAAASNTLKKYDIQESNNPVLDTIYVLAATVDAKDHYTYGHSKKVSKCAHDIAVEMGFSEEKSDIIRIAGLLHDIGKIGVSDDILSKNASLSDSEWKPIHAHPAMGVSILKHVDSIKDCLPGVLYHHEHFDGSGYPQGLKGENIPLDARILAVADSYDAMTSSRTYRKIPMTSEDAVEELIRCSGTQFDPDVVRVFISMLSRRNNTRFVFTHET
ncbi:MAG: diguanylate cyclase [Dehalococcoidales bacterium]|nr:diguanylate cyclase [Dehalococcoidales bacterium]